MGGLLQGDDRNIVLHPGPVNFISDQFQLHRDILNSDLIHLRRPDMQSIDGFMHVNPHLETKALAMLFNPTDRPQTMLLDLPLYYTGLKTKARVVGEGFDSVFNLDRNFGIEVAVSESLSVNAFVAMLKTQNRFRPVPGLSPRKFAWILVKEA